MLSPWGYRREARGSWTSGARLKAVSTHDLPLALSILVVEAPVSKLELWAGSCGWQWACQGRRSGWPDGAESLWRGHCALLWELETAGSLGPRLVTSRLQGQGRTRVVSQDQGLMCWFGEREKPRSTGEVGQGRRDGARRCVICGKCGGDTPRSRSHLLLPASAACGAAAMLPPPTLPTMGSSHFQGQRGSAGPSTITVGSSQCLPVVLPGDADTPSFCTGHPVSPASTGEATGDGTFSHQLQELPLVSATHAQLTLPCARPAPRARLAPRTEPAPRAGPP